MSQPGPSGDFGLDPDLARVAIDQLYALRDRIREVQQEAVTLAKSTPETAFDVISKQAFALLRQRADGGPGSLTWALDGGIEYVEKIIAQLEADLAQVIEQDADAARRISRS